MDEASRRSAPAPDVAVRRSRRFPGVRVLRFRSRGTESPFPRAVRGPGGLAAVVAAGALAAACGGALSVTLPEGEATPAPEAVRHFTQATAACAVTSRFSAELAVSGRLGRDRVRGRLLAATDREGRVRLEAVSGFGSPFFILASDGEAVVLFLPRDGRVLRHAVLAEVLDALAGLALDGRDLHALLTGCLVPDAEPANGRRLDRRFEVVDLGPGRLAVLRDGAPGVAWRLVSGQVGALRVAYGRFVGGRPRALRIAAGAAAGGRAVGLALELSQVEIDAPIDPRAWSVEVPPGAAPLALDELRRLGLRVGAARG